MKQSTLMKLASVALAVAGLAACGSVNEHCAANETLDDGWCKERGECVVQMQQPQASTEIKPVVVELVAVSLSNDVREACKDYNLPSPGLAYDSARMQPQDVPELKGLADCLTTGPLAGRNFTLIGHTDPRGSESYNEQLGSRRAVSVRDYLIG